jgi:hypothetical protein
MALIEHGGDGRANPAPPSTVTGEQGRPDAQIS